MEPNKNSAKSNASSKLTTEQVSNALKLNASATPDRRSGSDRRDLSRNESGYTGPERRKASRRGEISATERRLKEMGTDTGLEVVRGPGIRRDDERRSAEEGEMTAEQFEFVMAIESYKKVNKKMFPTWTEILGVFFQLGYQKVAPRKIKLDNVPEAPLYDPNAPTGTGDDLPETKAA